MPVGYAAAPAFLSSLGAVRVIGIEGTRCYGAGLARAARAAELEVREVIRPGRSVRHRRGKSDPIEASTAKKSFLRRCASRSAELVSMLATSMRILPREFEGSAPPMWDSPVERAERAARLGHHGVARNEAEPGIHRVDGVATGQLGACQ
jgi:hypothetical protein